MCGIVGLFLKDTELEPELGALIGEMLVKMSDRGPDSAGLALYSHKTNFDMKITLKFEVVDFEKDVEATLTTDLPNRFKLETRGTHIILRFLKGDFDLIFTSLAKLSSSFRIMSIGESIEILREVME